MKKYMVSKESCPRYILVQLQVIRLGKTFVQLEFGGVEFINTRVEFHPKS